MYSERLTEKGAQIIGVWEDVYTIQPYKSHRGIVSGGFGGHVAGKVMFFYERPTAAVVKACAPSYGRAEEPAPSESQLSEPGGISACGGSDLQITDVSFSRADIKPGQPLNVVVAVSNGGKRTANAENIECGIYPSSSPYIKNTFPKRINPLTLLSRGAANCVEDQDLVQTVTVLDLMPGATKLQSFSPQASSVSWCCAATPACQGRYPTPMRCC